MELLPVMVGGATPRSGQDARERAQPGYVHEELHSIPDGPVDPNVGSSIMEEFGSNDMAVLNIKNLPDSLYKKLQARAKRHHRSIAQEVTRLPSDVLETPKPPSILDLKGLGKERWKGIDVETHIARERNSWD